MHIAIISNSFQEDYESNLLNSLAGRIGRIDFIGSASFDKELFDKRINYYDFRGHDSGGSFYTKAMKNLRYYGRLLRYIWSTEATLFHFQWLRFPILDGVILPLLIRIRGRKVVYTAHNVLPHNKNNFFQKIQFKLVYKVVNHIVVHTEFIKKRLRDEFKINPSKVDVVIHGVYERILHEEVTKEKARSYFNLLPESFVILFFGGISKYKGLDLLMESIDSLEEEGIQIFVAGSLDSKYETDFKRLCEKYKSQNNVFVIRRIRDNEVEFCFKAANVTALPYREASQSGVLFMSYAYGVPVIAPAMGGFVKDVVPGKTGFLFSPNDCKDLADKITLLKGLPYFESEKHKASIREFAFTNYSWDKAGEELKAVYEAL